MRHLSALAVRDTNGADPGYPLVAFSRIAAESHGGVPGNARPRSIYTTDACKAGMSTPGAMREAKCR